MRSKGRSGRGPAARSLASMAKSNRVASRSGLECTTPVRCRAVCGLSLNGVSSHRRTSGSARNSRHADVSTGFLNGRYAAEQIGYQICSNAQPAMRQLHRPSLCGFIDLIESYILYYMLSPQLFQSSVRSRQSFVHGPVLKTCVVVKSPQLPSIRTIHSTALLPGRLSL